MYESPEQERQTRRYKKMNWNRTWMGVVALGIFLVVADLILRFGCGLDTFLGTHVYLRVLYEGNATNQHFVIPSSVGFAVIVVGVIGMLVTKKNQ